MTPEEQLAEVIIAAVKKAQAPLAKRVAALEAQPTLHDKGLWNAGQVYQPGAVVTKQGSAWVCTQTHMSTGNQLDHTSFRLLLKGRQ